MASLIWNGGSSGSTHDGKLLVAGKIYNTSTYGDVGVARYNLDGSLDTSFSSDGWATTAIGPKWDVGLAVAQQGDGKIVVVGYRGSDSPAVANAMIVVRYNVDGTLDDGSVSDTTTSDSFGVDSDGVDGVVIVDNASLDTASYAEADDVIIQSDGKIVVVGMAQTADPDGAGPLVSALDGIVLRLNSDGSFDTGFSSDGIVVQKIGNYNDAFFSVIQQSSGKLVAGGRAGADFAIVRYNTDGTLDGGSGTNDSNTGDTSFGTAGITSTDFSSRTDYGYSLLEQDDSGVTKLVLIGVSGTLSGSSWTDQDVAVVRYSSDGAIDTGYGSSGKDQINVGSLFAMGWDAQVQADSKLVIAGHAGTSMTTRDIAVFRVNQDGGLDTSFGSGDDLDDVDGVMTVDVNSGDDLGQAIEVISAPGQVNDGKLWVVGYGPNSTYTDFSVFRHHD